MESMIHDMAERLFRDHVSHGLLGEGAQSADAIGKSFAKGVNTGDQGNLKLRFDPSYMQMAADGKL